MDGEIGFRSFSYDRVLAPAQVLVGESSTVAERLTASVLAAVRRDGAGDGP
jgi:hypothetical protein